VSAHLTYMIFNVVLMLIVFYYIMTIILYDWTGTLYPTGFTLTWVFGGLDKLIPFVPWTDVFYTYTFYPFVIVTMCVFAFIIADKGYALGWSLVIIGVISIIFYIVFPTWTEPYRLQYLSQLTSPHATFWQMQVLNIYQTDTPFDCFPSFHASTSTICFYAWYRLARLKPHPALKAVAIASGVIAVCVMLSTLLIKQHYIADEIAGFVLAWVVGHFLFNKFWKSFLPGKIVSLPPQETAEA